MKPTPTSQKARGGYYTPDLIADFLARWAILSPTTSVFDPSCGDGALLESSIKVLRQLGASDCAISALIRGVEYDPEEAEKARCRISSLGIQIDTQIHTGDFFAYCAGYLSKQWLTGSPALTGSDSDNRVGGLVGNPPFIRYQNFLESHRAIAFEIMRWAGLHPNRLTNSWVPFLVASTFLLNKNGRLGMVIPAELFQVSYAAEIRRFLSDHYKRITVVTFKRLVFENILQEVVLLLCERSSNGGSEGIRVVELNDMGDLASFDPADLSDVELKPVDHSTEKWTQYFLEAKEILLLRELRSHPNLTMSGQVMDVDVGVVTGENSFFVLKDHQVRDLSLQAQTKPIVTRTSHLQGLAFTEADWQTNISKRYPCYLLHLPNIELTELPQAVQDYLEVGKQKGLPSQYKCRIRKHWYVVPSVWCPDAFILRQVHSYPKVVVNQVSATSTDTIHRVKFINGADGRRVAAAFLNSLTFAFSEVTGRSYGGGVLTFEPSESEKLPIPLVGSDRLEFERIDRFLREGNIKTILDENDKVLLIQGLGLTANESRTLRTIWEKLRDRRMGRN